MTIVMPPVFCPCPSSSLLNSGLVVCRAAAALRRRFEKDYWLLHTATTGVWFWGHQGRSPLLSIPLLVLRSGGSGGVWVDDQEGGGEEAQEGASRGHHWDDQHAAHRVHHRAQCRRHQDRSGQCTPGTTVWHSRCRSLVATSPDCGGCTAVETEGGRNYLTHLSRQSKDWN